LRDRLHGPPQPRARTPRHRPDLHAAGGDPRPGDRCRLSVGLDRPAGRGLRHLGAGPGLPGGLYGTIWILALAFIARFMPDTVKALSTSFLQIHKELEEAAWICGRAVLGTIAPVVLPLARPGVVASMTLLFVLAIRELGSSLFLYTSDTTVMAVLLLDYYEGGNTGKTAAFSLVQTAILGVLLGLTTWISRETTQNPRFN